MTNLNALLDQIDNETLLLPEFQRGYVWNRDQVRGLMRSLYLDYPVGSLLTWETDATTTDTRGSSASTGTRNLLLDGQQRITTLYGIIRGHAPKFFEGDPSTFTKLQFHVDAEVFEFYATVKMKDDPAWVDVTELLSNGMGEFLTRFVALEVDLQQRLSNLNQLHNILNRDFHIEKITGKDKTSEVVVDIFNRVNSGGTKLSKGDLALAKIAAQASSTRADMRDAITTWDAAGYRFKLDWLLRNVTAVATGKSSFRELDELQPSQFHDALLESRKHIGKLLDVVAGRLGLDHGRVLLAPAGTPVLARYLALNGGRFPNQEEQDKALYWLVQAGIWGRFSGSTETVLAQDMETLERRGLDGLIANVEQARGGTLEIRGSDFAGSSLGARFYPLLYLLTRVTQARDIATGVPLHSSLLGHNSSLQVHHLFPKAQLYAMRPPTSRNEVNAVANFALLTQDSNLAIGKRLPAEYFEEYESRFPGVLESQWIPQDEALWQLDAFAEFLRARRELLASAANSFLNSLLAGAVPEAVPLPRLSGLEVLGVADDEPGSTELGHALERLAELGLALPELDVEVSHPESGEIIAVAEAFWPDGLQVGRGRPALLELDGTDASNAALEGLGYQVFTSVPALLEFVDRESRADAGDESAS
jgi:hypothetical protein